MIENEFFVRIFKEIINILPKKGFRVFGSLTCGQNRQNPAIVKNVLKKNPE